MNQSELLISDTPVSQKKEDAFQRYPFAERVASTILNSSTSNSMVVGIYGKWGEGKSSVLNFIKTELQEQDVTAFDFNPWLFPNEHQLLISFFQALSSHLQVPIKGKGEKIGELLKDYAGAIGLLGSFMGMPNPKAAADSIGKRLANKPVEYYKNILNKALEDSGKKAVIFIDDIDRLSINEVQAVFKLIKLAADFKNTVYILSFDDELVAASLDPIYSKGGQDYLEKIVQLPLKLPKAQPTAIKRYVANSLNAVLQRHNVSIHEKELYRFTTIFDNGFLKMIENPRFAVRFSNSLNFAIPLLKGEVNLVDLIILEGVKAIHPSLYNFIRDNSLVFFGNFSIRGDNHKEVQAENDRRKLKINVCLDTYDESSRHDVRELLFSIFPQAAYVFKNGSPSELSWQRWYQDKRVCSGKYFGRYFTYTVVEGEISDVEFEAALSKISKKDFLHHKQELIQILSQFEPESMVIKLQFLENTFSNEMKRSLALNLSLIGGYEANSNNPKGIFGSILNPFRHLSSFICRCIDSQKSDNLSLAVSIISRSKPLSFAFEIWMYYLQKTGDIGTSVLSQEEFKQLSKALYERCISEYSLEELFRALDDDDLGHLLEIGAETTGADIKEQIARIIAKDSSNFIKLIYAFSPTMYSSAYTKPYKFKFTLSDFARLQKTVDIDAIYQTSNKLFGDQSSFEQGNEREPLTDNQLVGKFQQLYLAESLR